MVRSDLLTLKDIDSLLASWKARLSTAAQNLVDLRQHPRYQGTAGQQIGPLFQKLAQIQQVVDQASDLRKDWPMFGAEDRIKEIEKLLHGKSIELPPVPVPIEQRTLLGAVEHVECVSLDELMNSLVQGFATARDSVFAIDAAWLKLAELRRVHADRNRCTGSAWSKSRITRSWPHRLPMTRLTRCGSGWSGWN